MGDGPGHDVVIKLKNRLPASLGDMNDPDEGDLFLGDTTCANLPVWKLSLYSLELLRSPPNVSASNHRRAWMSKTHIKEPAHGTCDTLYKFIEGNRAARRGLVPGHDLGMPIAITGPLKKMRLF
jgi:hypothetical protein